MRARCVALALCVVTVLGQIDLESPYTVGNAGYGYRLGLLDGDGNIILASNPVDEFQTIITKSVLGDSGTPSGPESGQIALLKNKGYVVSGCISTDGTSKYLYAALSVPGYVVRVDLSFPSQAAQYLNATSSDLWGSNNTPQRLDAAVCLGRYVYFGTKATGVSTTILRLDTRNNNVATRFTSLGPVGDGDITKGMVWGNEILFVSEADSDSPTTFYTVSTSPFALRSASPALNVKGFDKIVGLSGDRATGRVFVASQSTPARVGVFDISRPSHSILTENIELQTQGLNPITSFVADLDSKYAYVTVGDCQNGQGSGMISLRLAPQLTQETFLVSDPTVFNCSNLGVPALSLLVTQVNDTLVSPGPRRTVIVFTQLKRYPGEPLRPGALVPYTVRGAGPCATDCSAASGQGACVGERCICSVAWIGANCDAPAPCGGTNCGGHGECLSDGTCVCDIGFTGAICEEVVPCPLGCSGHGSCNSPNCVCHPDYTGVACELKKVGCESLRDCTRRGTCQPDYPVGKCVCQTGYIGDDCSIRDLSCPNDCNNHGFCSQGSCVCEGDWTGEDCSLNVPSCPSGCSGRGDCNDGVCSCFPGFLGHDCSVVDTSACLHLCSGYGSCVQASCKCHESFSGSDCSTVLHTLQPKNQVTLATGENQVTASFAIRVIAREVVFCVGSTPGKCITFDSNTFTRAREGSFEDTALAALIQSAKPVTTKPRSALIPDMSSFMMLQVGASFGERPISVALVEDSSRGFAILGYRSKNGEAVHGQLVKVSTFSLTRAAELEFEDDVGHGVTAGVRGEEGSFFFASGSSPAMIYKVNSELEITGRVSTADAPQGEVSALIYENGRYLIATSGRNVHIYEVSGDTISAPSSISTIVLNESEGTVTAGFSESVGNSVAVYLGTSSSPATIVKLTISPSGVSTEALKLFIGENHIRSVVRHGSESLWGLSSSGDKCPVVLVDNGILKRLESTQLDGCSTALSSASLSPQGDKAYFGSADSPANVYSVVIFKDIPCPSNCSARGFCEQGKCSCNFGFSGSACEIVNPICPNDCSGAGVCRNSVCECENGHFGDDCSVVQTCKDKCMHGHCAGDGGNWPCVCSSESWTGEFCTESTGLCPHECQGHGTCNKGTCACDVGYTGDDCGRTVPVIRRGCSADADCGTHGVCLADESRTGHCKCVEGWTGEDCDVDQAFLDAIAPTKISPVALALICIAAALAGVAGAVAIIKSGPANKQSPGTASFDSGPVPAATGYTRFPHPSHRLAK